MNVAAIDLGTNSTRLLVLDDDGRTVERRSEITRLGGALTATGRLDASGSDRTLDVLRDYRAAIDRHGVTKLRVVGTAATRQAAGADAFLAAVGDVIGQQPEVLSGAEEGRLTFLGATADLDPNAGPFLVIDIGGGSTELAVGPTVEAASSGLAGPAVSVASFDLGCVSLTESELVSDPPRPEELTNAIALAADELANARLLVPAIDDVHQVVGVAGTITTVAAIELGLATYDRQRVHGLALSKKAVEDVFRTLATEPLADRVHNPGLPRARADVIVGGCCILVALMRNLPAREIVVSDADLLDALAHSLR